VTHTVPADRSRARNSRPGAGDSHPEGGPHRDLSGVRGARSIRRLTAGVVALLLVGGIFSVPAVPAAAEPSPAEARRKVQKLNEEVDRIVERYNKATVDLKAAQRRLQAINKSVARERKAFQALRGRLAQLAASAYKTGDVASAAEMVSANDPQTILDQAAVFNHIARNRSSDVTEFLATAQRLQREQAQAKAGYDEVKRKAADLKSQKAKVEKAIAKQRKYLPASERSSGPSGGSYTGPASGPARVALQFAYSKIGTPYQYGGTGPRYDCSGLTMRAWQAAGVSLPRTTYQQINAGRRVAFKDLQPGDLFFGNSVGHVGLYAGDGKIVHSPRTGKSVEVVSIAGYYTQNFAGAVRP
jgi:cell wall-associated NlpC family hydrolase